jgi:hypothetical protein
MSELIKSRHANTANKLGINNCSNSSIGSGATQLSSPPQSSTKAPSASASSHQNDGDDDIAVIAKSSISPSTTVPAAQPVLRPRGSTVTMSVSTASSAPATVVVTRASNKNIFFGSEPQIVIKGGKTAHPDADSVTSPRKRLKLSDSKGSNSSGSSSDGQMCPICNTVLPMDNRLVNKHIDKCIAQVGKTLSSHLYFAFVAKTQAIFLPQ